MRWFQCRFRRGAERTVAWIEARGAKMGARVELTTLDDNGAWEVEHVSAQSLGAAALKQKQKFDRNPFASIRRIAWT